MDMGSDTDIRAAGTGASTTPPPLGRTPITIDPRRTATWLMVIAVALTVLSIATDALVLARGPFGLAGTRLIDFVDLDGEANLPALFSTLLLLGAAVLLAIIARHQHANGGPGVVQWATLAVLFLGLGIDETIGVHETMIGPFRRMFPDNRLAYFGWVIPGAVFVVVVGSVFTRFLLGLQPRLRNLFVAAGAIFVGGALGLELVEGYIASDIGEDNWPYVIALTAQELLEMGGAILFLYALLEHLSTLTSGLDVRWVTRAPGPRPG